jgi:hypothetical protein
MESESAEDGRSPMVTMNSVEQFGVFKFRKHDDISEFRYVMRCCYKDNGSSELHFSSFLNLSVSFDALQTYKMSSSTQISPPEKVSIQIEQAARAVDPEKNEDLVIPFVGYVKLPSFRYR